MTETAMQTKLKAQLLDAALINVAFDGWSEATFRAACQDVGVDRAVADVICPRGAVDLALAYHQCGDQIMLDRLADTDLSTLRLRERIATAVRFRIEAIDDKEAVRRGSALFSLPLNAGEGARAIWGTADAIWTALGDTSDDANWYTKRMNLGGVYGATVLFWLGDDSDDQQATWDFLDRQIENVLSFEKVRAQIANNPLSKVLLSGPNWVLGKVRPPSRARRGFPGTTSDDNGGSTAFSPETK